MKRFFAITMIAGGLALLAGCHSNNAPDVSGIAVNIKLERFDQFFFQKTDTTTPVRTLSQLQSAFPYFTNDFITNILELPPPAPPYTDSGSAATFRELKLFLRLTQPIYDSVSSTFQEAATTRELTQAFRYLKYYFPGYRIPPLVTYLGPFNAPGVAITNQAIAVGLQLFGGKNFSFYTSEAGIALYPSYISRRFEQQYIPANVMTAIINDIYPDRSTGRPLVEQMVEKGKQWYLLDKLLPETPDSIKTGYTNRQLDWCKENEGLIWDFFLQSNELYTAEPALVKSYIGEAPATQEMSPASPGNIGQWTGWRIVQAYSNKHPELGLDELMKTSAREIFTASKYKPRYK
ncbi:MAG: hypothetical protein INR73_22940 [Williamsia sp.]|nr:hypothetical protein [Williamsia sp.]